MHLDHERFPPGTHVYAVDDRQGVVRGTLGKQYGAHVELLTELGPGVTRRRMFHSRYVTRDYWRDLEDLP